MGRWLAETKELDLRGVGYAFAYQPSVAVIEGFINDAVIRPLGPGRPLLDYMRTFLGKQTT